MVRGQLRLKEQNLGAGRSFPGFCARRFPKCWFAAKDGISLDRNRFGAKRTKMEHNFAKAKAGLLARERYRDRPVARFLSELALATGRAHEFCGLARRTLALMAIRGTQGPVFWIRPVWQPDWLNPDGLMSFIDPGRLIFVEPTRSEDILWSAEEVLRSGAVPVVVADLPSPPRLTPVRRLHLAAENGAERGRAAPFALLLVPGGGGAQGVESRWQFSPRHKLGRTSWRLARLKARGEPPKTWKVEKRGTHYMLAKDASA